MPVAIRVNGIGTEWHSLDLDAVARSKADFVVVPRAIFGTSRPRRSPRRSDKPVLAMIETAAGVLAAAEIAHRRAGLIAGTNDLRADLRLPLDATREPISTALQMIVLAARAAGIAAFDGVFNRLDDAEGFLQRGARRDGGSASTARASSTPTRSSHATAPSRPSAAEVERAQGAGRRLPRRRRALRQRDDRAHARRGGAAGAGEG